MASINFLGTDTTEYAKYYTLKRTTKENPWEDIIKAAEPLCTLPIGELEEGVKDVLDVDRALWFVAHENVWADDDSYVYKGGMDYYLYYEIESDRIIPLEYDGNSCMQLGEAQIWSIFMNETDEKFPLMSRLLKVPSLRQRYLAHIRTIRDLYMDEEYLTGLIDEFADKLRPRIENDPRRLFSLAEFEDGIEDLKSFVILRKAYLSSLPELNVLDLEIEALKHSVDGVDWNSPQHMQEANITVDVIDGPVEAVNLYYSDGLVGSFDKITMFDDGMHGDGAAGDGTFGANIPGQSYGTIVRYYVEAIKDDPTKTASFFPRGAEHDVYFYEVQLSQAVVSGDMVINEFMASNDTAIADEAGEFDDWVELRNNSLVDIVDFDGWHLTDTLANPTKWSFPEGTSLSPQSYLTIWLDEDQSQGEFHANFKLDADGEEIYLINADGNIVDQVIFETQTTDLSYSRIPNGTGEFVIKDFTFGFSNEFTSSIIEEQPISYKLYPNPVHDFLVVESSTFVESTYQVFNLMGAALMNIPSNGTHTEIDLSSFKPGIYLLSVNNEVVGRFVKF